MTDDRKELGLATASDDLTRLRLHILPVLGTMPIEEVRPRHIRDLVLAMRKTDVLAPRSIRHVYATAACMFRTAVADELIPFTPCVLAKGACGLRHSEASGLRWRQYDHGLEPLGALNLERTKTQVPRRVPVHPTLARILHQASRTLRWRGLVLSDTCGRMKMRLTSLPLLIVVLGSYLTACGGSSGGGAAGAGGGGHAGSGAGGHAGSAGGQAGTSAGGQAGTSAGGQAGTSVGGQAGTSVGGQAGTNAGGQAGTSVGGQAGTSVGGQAGTSAGGQAGTSVGGHAGTSVGGQAGTSVGGQAGTSVGGQAGTSVGGQAGGGGAPGACNNVVNGAPVVDKNHHADAPPAMTGGTIVDGTYFLTAMDKYNGETGTSSHQETWVYSGNTIQVVQLDGTRFSLAYTISGNALTFTITCPAAQAGKMGTSPYTATATQIVTVNSDDANELHTFTKQ